MGRLLFLFALIAIFLSLVYVFYRGMAWSLGLARSKALLGLFYTPALLLLLLTFTRQIHHIHGIFAIFATTLALLWLFTLSSMVVLALNAAHKALWWQQICRAALPILFLITVAYAWFNAHNPQTVHYTVTLNKPAPKLRIGFVADLHLGNQVGVKEIERLHQIFKQEQVDMVLMPGDIINDDATPYYEQGMDKAMKALAQDIPLGVFGTMGNHEYYGDELQNAQALRDGGIRLLRNESALVNGQWLVVGRDDNMNRNRPQTSDLLDELLGDVLYEMDDARPQTAQLLPNAKQSALPVLLLDHRPTDIVQHADLSIDIQVSGHTHQGQIFPANFITNAMYPLDYGHEQFGNGHYFVTSGYGFWGVPLRLGSRSEVVIIDVKGKE